MGTVYVPLGQNGDNCPSMYENLAKLSQGSLRPTLGEIATSSLSTSRIARGLRRPSC